MCDLCTARAQHEGWIREAGADELALRGPRQDGRRSLLDRLRNRRRAGTSDGGREHAGNGHEPVELAAGEDPTPTPVPAPQPSRRPRHVRAVPTNAELKMQRALEVFNASPHVRTVGGVSRSLGAPAVCVRPLAERPAVVTITVMWELSWYRFEVDLSDEGAGVRRDAQGDELSELPGHEQDVNAAADERGALHLASPGAP